MPHPTHLSREELRYTLALWRTPLIGPSRWHKLQSYFSNLADIFRAPIIQLQQLQLPEASTAYIKNPDWPVIEQDLLWAEKPQNYILTLDDPHYPALLKQAPKSPNVLFVEGDITLLSTPQIAIVGSRNPSPSGNEIAYQFAQSLATSGLTITSGLALGIDASSHRGTLAASAKTIAVLGAGLDHIYPRSNKTLAEKISANGALVSEYPLGVKPTATHFPQRNRIICGLSLGVVVVEATLRSGSLITARLAAEYGREVFAIPGSIHNPLARGCHHLIGQGAKLVETVQDIIEELNPLIGFVLQQSMPATITTSPTDTIKLSLNQQKILANIGFETTSIDLLIQRTGFSAAQVASLLLMLEMRGAVIAVPGGYVRKPPS